MNWIRVIHKGGDTRTKRVFAWLPISTDYRDSGLRYRRWYWLERITLHQVYRADDYDEGVGRWVTERIRLT